MVMARAVRVFPQGASKHSPRMTSLGMRSCSLPMGKLMRERWVWAPQYLSEGTCSSPMVSASTRIPLAVEAGRSCVVAGAAAATAPPPTAAAAAMAVVVTRAARRRARAMVIERGGLVAQAEERPAR